jgi:lysophospholipase
VNDRAKGGSGSGPRLDLGALPDIEATGGRQGIFEADDGVKLRYAHWPGAGPSLVLLPGFTEFIEKYLDVVARLQERRFQVWMLDWRGQGLSARPLADPQKPFVADFALYSADLDRFMRRMVMADSTRPPSLLAHSMGGHIALRWLHEHRGRVERAVLMAPMVDIALGPLTRRFARALAWSAVRFGFSTLYIPGAGDYGPERQVFEGNRLTSDPDRFQIAHRWIDKDPRLATGGPTLGWLDAAFRSIDYIGRPGVAEAIEAPVLIVQAGRDTLVSLVAQAKLAQRLKRARLLIIEASKHEVLKERDELQRVFWAAFDDFHDAD